MTDRPDQTHVKPSHQLTEIIGGGLLGICGDYPIKEKKRWISDVIRKSIKWHDAEVATLTAQRDALLEALKGCLRVLDDLNNDFPDPIQESEAARAAIELCEVKQ